MAFAERDGVRLAYEEAGSGDPPIVLLHPWSGDRSFFAPQVERFRTDHRCVAG